MKKRRSGRPRKRFLDIAAETMRHSLFQRLQDRSWDELKEVYQRPDVQAAERVIMSALAEAFSPTEKSARAHVSRERNGHGRPKAKRDRKPKRKH